MDLRPYQHEAASSAQRGWSDGKTHQLLVMATGTGKTATGLEIVMNALRCGERVVWLAHRTELIEQPWRAVARWWPESIADVGIVQAELDEHDRRLVFASVPTLARPGRAERVRGDGIDLVVLDEAHHGAAVSYVKVIERLAPKRMLGLTATADRADGLSLGEHWQIAYDYGIASAIRDEWLIPPYVIDAPVPDLDLSGLAPGNDYDADELGARLLAAHVVEWTVAQLTPGQPPREATELPERAGRRFLVPDGRKTLIFTATIEQGRKTAEALTAAGVPCEHLSGETPPTRRAGILERFDRGDLQAIANAAVLTEGTDLPSCSCIVLARPTRSWAFATQMIGRGLRPYPGQRECLLLDLGQVTRHHDLRAAPILIGGTRCRASANGLHAFEKREDGKGECEHCGVTIPCFEAKGPHVFVAGRCTRCGKVQCSGSPDGRHAWVANEAAGPGHRKCAFCDAQSTDPLAGLFAEQGATTPAPWARLYGLEPETYAVDAAPHGTIYVVGSRDNGGSWLMYWHRKGWKTPRKLVDRKIPGADVRAWAEDIVRRSDIAAQVNRKATTAEQLPPLRASDSWRAESTRAAIHFGLARRAGV